MTPILKWWRVVSVCGFCFQMEKWSRRMAMEARTCPPPSPLHDSNHFHAQAPYLWEQSISAPSSYNREVVQAKMAKKVHLGSAKSTCSIFSVHIL